MKGFTLIELLVVVAIIGILAVLAVVTINPAARINSSKDAQAIANVSQIGKALESCISDRMTLQRRSNTQAIDDCCGSTIEGSCVSDQTHGLNLYGLGYLNGLPNVVTVNRGATGGTTLCVAQQRSSDNKYVGYIVGGGSLSTTSAGGCVAGVLQP